MGRTDTRAGGLSARRVGLHAPPRSSPAQPLRGVSRWAGRVGSCGGSGGGRGGCSRAGGRWAAMRTACPRRLPATGMRAGTVSPRPCHGCVPSPPAVGRTTLRWHALRGWWVGVGQRGVGRTTVCTVRCSLYMQMANRRWARLNNRLAKKRQQAWTESARRLKRALSQSDTGISPLLTSARQHKSSMLSCDARTNSRENSKFSL